MASIKNNGQEVIILCNMGYDYDGKKIKPVSKSVFIPEDLPQGLHHKWLSEQADIFENEVKARRAEPMPLVLFIIQYREEIRASINNKDIERISQRLGTTDIKEVTPAMLENFHKQIQEETELPFTAREHLHRVLCEIFKLATELGYITINPIFRTFRYEKKQLGNVQTVKVKQIQKLVKCLVEEQPKHRLFYSLVIATGLNRAEVVQLKWEQISFRKKEIDGIPLPKSIMEQLNTLKQDDGYIFAQPNGKAMCPSSFT